MFYHNICISVEPESTNFLNNLLVDQLILCFAYKRNY